MAKKWYVVWRGRTPGIYTSWDDAKAQIHGFKAAQYQSFKTQSTAEAAFRTGYKVKSDPPTTMPTGIEPNSIAVDAACSGNPGIVEYRGVDIATRRCLFHKKIDGLGTNNCGEFLAIVHALAWQEKQATRWTIYSDSDVAIGWVRKKRFKTTLVESPDTRPILDLMHRATAWLDQHRLGPPICKWMTRDWGEIPADFGRKSG